MSNYPFENQFPLTDYPYSSREWSNSVDSDPTKNYKMIGFKPGAKLQASELNELQEIFYVQQTLSMNMIHYWLEEVNNKSMTSGPAWEGATPLFPFTNSSGSTMIGFTYSLTPPYGITINMNEGWYLIKEISGIKSWAYLNNSLTRNYGFTPGYYYYAGLSYSTEIVDCADDTTLTDNSSGLWNESVCGADRYQININSIEVSPEIGFNDNFFNKILKFGSNGATFNVYYINGITL
jgi:hypothetical protein